MAYDYRRIVNGAYGQLTTLVSAVATSITEPAFSTLPTIAAASPVTEYIPITLADTAGHLVEIVWITAHAANSSTVTVERAREGTTARGWPVGTLWGQNPTRRDGMADEDGAALPTDRHVGMELVERTSGAQKRQTKSQGLQAAIGVALPSDVGPTRNAVAIPADAAILVRAGVVSVTTNSVGDGNIQFKVPFPNGCVAVVGNSADYTTFGGTVNPWAEGKSGFDARYIDPAGLATPNVTIKISYTAIGW